MRSLPISKLLMQYVSEPGAQTAGRGARCVNTTTTIGALTLAGLMLMLGCSQTIRNPLMPPEPPIVWPKPPDVPRVRFLGQITGSKDFRPHKTLQESWEEFLYGPKPASVFVTPQAVAVHQDGNRIAVADTNAVCLHMIDLAASRYKRKDSAGSPPQSFQCPAAVAWAGDALWVVDAKLHALAIIEPSGQSRWIGGNVLTRPVGLAYCPDNELCYVADAAAHEILAFDRNGTLVLQFGSRGTGPGQFNTPSHVACGPGPTLAVADSLNFRVQRFGPDGTPLGMFGRKGDASGDFALPKGVAFDPEGHLWVVDAHFENVQAFTSDGQLLMAIGHEGNGIGEFSLPAGIYIDVKRRIWIADSYNRRVQVFELMPS